MSFLAPRIVCMASALPAKALFCSNLFCARKWQNVSWKSPQMAIARCLFVCLLSYTLVIDCRMVQSLFDHVHARSTVVETSRRDAHHEDLGPGRCERPPLHRGTVLEYQNRVHVPSTLTRTKIFGLSKIFCRINGWLLRSDSVGRKGRRMTTKTNLRGGDSDQGSRVLLPPTSTPRFGRTKRRRMATKSNLRGGDSDPGSCA